MIPQETAPDEPKRIGSFTPARLFAERAAAFWKAIWGCWRTVLDWTVCLYILLPGIFIAVGTYRDFMRDPPAVLAEFPLYPILLFLTLLQLAGKYRTFAEAGDGLFLYRNSGWRRGFGRMGFVYGGASRLLVSFAAAAALSPILLPVFGLSAASLAALAVYYAAAGLLWTMLRDRIALSWRGWRRWLASLPAGAAFVFGAAELAAKGAANPGMTLLLGAAFLAAACLLLLLRLRKRGTLLHEIATENEIYAAFVGWILMDTLEKKPIPRRSKPILFSRSQPLLKHRNNDVDRLADSWMKSVVRRPDLLKQLLYFLWAGAAAIALTPIPLAVIVWLALPFLVSASLRRQWKQWMSEPYVALFDWQDAAEKEASRKAALRLALPLVLLWALLIALRIGWTIGGWAWLAVAAAPVAAYYWLKTVSEITASFAASRRRRE
ncbi:ABC transporter permease [Cohnella cellulosilytica]|uniref:ABC transporter permease n=1 Tax=Cohnella cellulosilytica TaxID=986710 RepID=A0ABW2FFA9_9BACL